MLKLITMIVQAAMAIDLQDIIPDLACNGMEVSGPIEVKEDNVVIRDKIIYAPPTSADDHSNDFALSIKGKNVTIENVLIYHAANGRGIFAKRSDNLRIENVQVIAYGNEWGA